MLKQAVAAPRAEYALSEYGKHYKRGEFVPFYVPRLYMPQILPQFLPDAFVQAFSDGLAPDFDVVTPESLHAHQRVNHALAKAMDPVDFQRPILISSDGYILDGNHRWWAHIHNKIPLINVIRIGHTFDEAISWLNGLKFCEHVGPNGNENADHH